MDLPEANSTIGVICTVCEQDTISLALSRSTVVEEDRENSMIIFRIKFEFEMHTCTYKFCKSADLKFPVSGRSIVRRIDTRVRNAVTLVWGSLRLAPITINLCIVTVLKQ